MSGLRQYLFIMVVCSTILSAKNLAISVGVDTRGADSIYDSKPYVNIPGIKEKKQYGYEGFIGGRVGIDYFFSQRNGIRAFLSLGYSSLKLLNYFDKFDLYSGVGTRVGVDYLFNYYSDEKFDFGIFAGLGYFNAYYERGADSMISNQFLGNLGLNMTIDSKHRLEIGLNIPIFSVGRYHSKKYGNIPVVRQFNNVYYGISYMFLFGI